MKQPLALLLTAVLSGTASGHAQDGPAASAASPNGPGQRTSIMKISITAGNTVITATLEDNATSRDFASLLPLTVTLEDHAATEKIGYLPRKLSTEGAPAGSDPRVGDVAYYALWGNLALFHKDFAYSSGLIRLGQIDFGLEALSVPGTVRATIERLEK